MNSGVKKVLKVAQMNTNADGKFGFQVFTVGVQTAESDTVWKNTVDCKFDQPPLALIYHAGNDGALLLAGVCQEIGKFKRLYFFFLSHNVRFCLFLKFSK